MHLSAYLIFHLVDYLCISTHIKYRLWFYSIYLNVYKLFFHFARILLVRHFIFTFIFLVCFYCIFSSIMIGMTSISIPLHAPFAQNQKSDEASFREIDADENRLVKLIFHSQVSWVIDTKRLSFSFLGERRGSC